MNLPVHPLTSIFPMMDDKELDELAEDIKQNGLIMPIVLSDDGTMLIDGRNRLAACEKIGRTPEFAKLNGEDPVAFIISCNIKRRHLSKGQKAMAVAMAVPEASHGGHREKGVSGASREFSKARLFQAREVVKHSAELAKAVLAGTETLDNALTQIRDQRIAANPEKVAKRQQKSNTDRLSEILESIGHGDGAPDQWAKTMLASINIKLWPKDATPFSPSLISACADRLMALASLVSVPSDKK